MKETQKFVVKVNDEETARQRAIGWYAHKPNLTVDEVKPYQHGGYQVTISYDIEEKRK